jgi:DNA-binding response OmpR family regulator
MAGPGRRILLVEDERSITKPLAAALEREGFVAEVVALSLTRSRPPTVSNLTSYCSM